MAVTIVAREMVKHAIITKSMRCLKKGISKIPRQIKKVLKKWLGTFSKIRIVLIDKPGDERFTTVTF